MQFIRYGTQHFFYVYQGPIQIKRKNVPADVSGIEPVSLMVSGGAVSPRKEVVMAISIRSGVLHSICACAWVRPDKFALGQTEGEEKCDDNNQS